MKRSQVYLLLAVLSLATFYLWSKVHRIESDLAEYEQNRFFPEATQANVQSVQVFSADPRFEYLIELRGGRWYLDGHLANLERTPSLLYSILELTREREMDAEPSDERLKEFGLTDPTYRIAVQPREEGRKPTTVLLGMRAPDGNHFYGRSTEEEPIYTVPAYTLSPLEDEPKDLIEKALFPVEVAALEEFTWEKSDGESTTLVSDPNKEEIRFHLPGNDSVQIDETSVKDWVYALKEVKVSRFLSSQEEIDLSHPVIRYQALEDGSDARVVTEIARPVPITPNLRYGRRFLTRSDELEPLPQTEERFVVDLSSEERLLNPNLDIFLDRRLFRGSVDEVTELEVRSPSGFFKVRKQGQDDWDAQEQQNLEDSVDLNQVSPEVLWFLRDLRWKHDDAESAAEGPDLATLEMTLGRQGKHTFRFVGDESGKPYVAVDGRAYEISEESASTLKMLLERIFPTPSASL